MLKYSIRYSFDGVGRVIIEADSEAEPWRSFPAVIGHDTTSTRRKMRTKCTTSQSYRLNVRARADNHFGGLGTMKHAVGTPRKRRTWYTKVAAASTIFRPSKHAAAKSKPAKRKGDDRTTPTNQTVPAP
jgi:hypothetical protein